MAGQSQHDDVLTAEFFQKHYVEERMSYPKIREMLLKQGHNIHVGTLHNYAKSYGIGRTRSQAKVNEDPNPLNWEISYLSEFIIESVDGFLLGDGSLFPNPRGDASRLQCGLQHEEFCTYLMSHFSSYHSTTKQYKDAGMKSGHRWQGSSKFHPDLYAQHQRWYPNGGTKQPPEDVRITPLSVMMWYLGDGSLVQGKNTVMIRLSTDGFTANKVEFLAQKLRDVGIACHRNNDNRIVVDAKGIPAFFDFIGRKSPVECYDYKFDLPEWRFEAKRLKEVAEELGVSYNRISHLVKTGVLGCYRASEKGRPRMLPEHVEAAKKLVKEKVLY